MLPLLLGVIGLIYQLSARKKGVQSFWVTFFLFFMTGIAIVIYLNQTPLQPRERDYAYAGSFYAFSIWVGFGVIGLWKALNHLLKRESSPIIAMALSLLCLLVPVQMAGENWDDHDRSNRYVCRDFGMNYLSSCAPNSIIFTYGDNDTFPLWYAQEVEGFRTDVRVCNLSYLQTDWYIDQMKRKAYDSDPLPINWDKKQYRQGEKDIFFIFPHIKEPLSLGAVLDFAKDEQRPKWKQSETDAIYYIPTNFMVLPINKEEVLSKGVVRTADSLLIAPRIDIKFDENKKIALYKHELIILDMLLNSNWDRPIYYAISVREDMYLNLDNYFQLTGMAQRIVPMNTAEIGNTIDTETMYDNMMNKFRWGNVADPKVYLDENTMRMCQSSRYMFTRLSQSLIEEGKNDKALAVLDRCMEVLPAATIPLTGMYGLELGEQYFMLEQYEKAIEIYRLMGDDLLRSLNWFSNLVNNDLLLIMKWFYTLRINQFNSAWSDVQYNLAILQQIVLISREYAPDFAKEYEAPFYEMVNKVRAINEQKNRK